MRHAAFIITQLHTRKKHQFPYLYFFHILFIGYIHKFKDSLADRVLTATHKLSISNYQVRSASIHSNGLPPTGSSRHWDRESRTTQPNRTLSDTDAFISTKSLASSSISDTSAGRSTSSSSDETEGKCAIS